MDHHSCSDADAFARLCIIPHRQFEEAIEDAPENPDKETAFAVYRCKCELAKMVQTMLGPIQTTMTLTNICIVAITTTSENHSIPTLPTMNSCFAFIRFGLHNKNHADPNHTITSISVSRNLARVAS